jgi:predicted PurR-regulated permease PerM
VPVIKLFAEELDLAAFATTVTGWLSERATGVLAGSVFTLLSLVLTLYVLFFFLRDRKLALRSIRLLAPLTRAEWHKLQVRLDDTIHATVYGTLATSLVQGLLGGLMFWFLGLPSALLWGVVMALLSVVPVLGAFIVWVPAALYLAISGDWGKALILAAWGTFVVGSADNLLRPLMVGKRLEQHTVLAFFSVVGGLFLFGAVGLILGPLVLTFTTVLLEIWSGRNAADAANDDEAEPATDLGPPILAPMMAAPTRLEPEPIGTSSPPER